MLAFAGRGAVMGRSRIGRPRLERAGIVVAGHGMRGHGWCRFMRMHCSSIRPLVRNVLVSRALRSNVFLNPMRGRIHLRSRHRRRSPVQHERQTEQYAQEVGPGGHDSLYDGECGEFKACGNRTRWTRMRVDEFPGNLSGGPCRDPGLLRQA